MSVLSIPKYARAKQKILSFIGEKSIKSGERLPSEKEMSEMFEVSMITLRRALLELEADSVVDRVQGKGTFVKSKILNGASLGTVGFLAIDQWTYPSPQQLEDLRKLLYQRGYGLRYYVPGRTPDNVILEDLIKMRGVLISGWVTDEWLSFLDNCGVSTVVIGNYQLSRKAYTVCFNWVKACKIMVEHFVNKGLRRIGLVCSAKEFYPGQEIYKGFCQGCKKYGLDFSDKDIVWPEVGNEENAIMGFLQARSNDYDALIVEEGNYLHLLTCLWEQNYKNHPVIGIMGENIYTDPEYSNLAGIKFQNTITEKAIEILFSILDKKGFTPETIEIEPSINC